MLWLLFPLEFGFFPTQMKSTRSCSAVCNLYFLWLVATKTWWLFIYLLKIFCVIYILKLPFWQLLALLWERQPYRGAVWATEGIYWCWRYLRCKWVHKEDRKRFSINNPYTDLWILSIIFGIFYLSVDWEWVKSQSTELHITKPKLAQKIHVQE